MTDGADVDDNDASDLAMQALFTREVIAFHEAAHAVVRYRTFGCAGGMVSIVSLVDVRLGFAEDWLSDGFNPARVESKILTCYAGGHAQRKVDARCGAFGCWGDDETAGELLREFGWEGREQELRDRALTLTQQHWPEMETVRFLSPESSVVAVAEELLRVTVLDDAEVEILADAAGGVVDPDNPVELTNLTAYRRARGPSLDEWRQRQMWTAGRNQAAIASPICAVAGVGWGWGVR